MPLNMTRPYRHPTTGVYWLRKGVPQALRPIIGKRELKRSLRTKDVEEAKRRTAGVLAAFDSLLDIARQGQRCTSEDLNALVGAYFEGRSKELLARARREGWDNTSFEGAAASHEASLNAPSAAASPEESGGEDRDNPAEHAAAVRWGEPRVAALLETHGLALRPDLRRDLGVQLYRAEGQALTDAQARYGCRGGYSPPTFQSLPSPEVRSFSALFDVYADARGLAPETRADWRSIVEHFSSFLSGKRPDRVTRTDIRRYVDHLQTKGGLTKRPLSAKRINEAYIAIVRAMYAWAIKHEKLTDNPAGQIAVEVHSGNASRQIRGFTAEELSLILTASRREDKAFKRWVPWLCSFTGARVSEILNAHKAHVQHTEGIWYLSIRGDTHIGANGQTHTSRVKTASSNRCVPLHNALIAEGFLEYVATVPDGDFLFPGKWEDQHGNRTKGPSNQLRVWLHRVIDMDHDLHPTHSFRHWLHSQARRVKMDADVLRQITGHKFTDVHGRYGPADIPMLSEALNEVRSPLAPLPDHGG